MMVTPLYAGLLVLWFLVLSVRVIRRRGAEKIALGDGGNAGMMRLIRGHANFAEYVPLALLLMALAESLGTGIWLLHALGIALLGGRLVHAFGMSQAEEKFAFRVTGVVTTFSMLGTAALACLYGALTRGIGI